jgi:peptidyl-prolyl cis-trans isomerase C
MPVPADCLAIVNGETLSLDDARHQITQLLAQQGVPQEAHEQVLQQHGTQIIEQVTDRFIDMTLLKAEAARRELVADEEDIDAAVQKITDTLPEGVTLDEAMKSQGKTVDALRDDVAASEKVHKLFKEITADVAEVTDEDVTTFYGENEASFASPPTVDARHILIKCERDADETLHQMCKAKAESVQRKLVDGGDFAALAAEDSECPSKEKGGALGAFPRGKMAPEFEEAAFSQAVDEIGSVVQTTFGYHIIQVTGKDDGETAAFEDVSSQIRTHLEGSAKEKVFGEFAKSLRDGAEIEISTPS